MAENQKLLEEVMDGAKAVPPEYQRHLLDVGKAMALTRRIVTVEQEKKEQEPPV